MAAEKEVLLPDIGDFADVEIVEVLVAPGDRVKAEDSLLTLESDKATIEIPAPFPGTIKDIRVRTGDKVSQGTLLLTMEDSVAEETAAPPRPAAEEMEVPIAPASPAPQPPPAAPKSTRSARLPGEKEAAPAPVPVRPSDLSRSKPHASPAVRRFARELGVELALITGSGPKARITRDDVRGFVKKSLAGGIAPATTVPGALQFPGALEVDFSRFGETETRPLARIRRLSGAHLHRCWLTIPHVTQFDQADITELETFRKAQKAELERQRLRLTFMPFLMQACAAALRALPQFNSALTADGENLIYRKFVHIGVAVDTPNGLVVPVLRDVDQKSVLDLARELGEVSAKARDGKLLPADMQGGCFSISSLGGIGGTAFTPIVNAPEVAILGVSRATMEPVWNGSEFRPRLLLPLSLSYDHRVIDGADGVRFTTLLGELLSDIRRLLL